MDGMYANLLRKLALLATATAYGMVTALPCFSYTIDSYLAHAKSELERNWYPESHTLLHVTRMRVQLDSYGGFGERKSSVPPGPKKQNPLTRLCEGRALGSFPSAELT